MDLIDQVFAGKPARAALVAMAIICGAIATFPASIAWSAPVASTGSSGRINSRLQDQSLQFAAESAAPAAPDQTGDDDTDVPTSQVDKYIGVYAAMQKDHNLTVEQAASKQGLTVAQFRKLEGRIERDDMLRERVRKALRHAVNPNSKESSDE